MAARSAIGLDIGTSGVRAAELAFTRNSVSLERFGQVAVPEGAVRDGEVIDGPSVTAAIKELWSATRFRSKKVVIGVANQRVAVRTVDFPHMGDAQLKKALPFLAAEFITTPIDESLLDFHPLELFNDNDGSTKVKGMLVAANRDLVMANVQCVQAAGLDPQMVDLTTFALLRAVSRNHDPLVESAAVIDIGARVTNVVVHSSGMPRFVRIMTMGGEDINEALSERLGITHEEAEVLKYQVGMGDNRFEHAQAARVIEEIGINMVDELQGSLDYYRNSHREFPLDRITVSGGGSQLAGLIQRLAEVTGIDTRAADPMDSMDIGRTGLNDQQLAMVQPLSAVPVGLALGAA